MLGVRRNVGRLALLAAPWKGLAGAGAAEMNRVKPAAKSNQIATVRRSNRSVHAALGQRTGERAGARMRSGCGGAARGATAALCRSCTVYSSCM